MPVLHKKGKIKMIEAIPLKTEEDFICLAKGDFVACEWHRDVHMGKKRTRFATYKVVENKAGLREIILQKKHNIYFNYGMFVENASNLKSIVKLISK